MFSIHYMRHALRLAGRGLGHTWPNPSVGAVIVKDNVILGCGITARGGRPHAETVALAQAGEQARGATLYVTLEPCAHHGKTLPCTDAIIAAGIKQVVIACVDPNPLVGGKGVAQLKAAGIEVVQGVCEAEAQRLNEGFFSVISRKRPFVTLKIATSLDGKIADAEGNSKWITGEASRCYGHYLRGSHDAILTGICTAQADDPELTCRLPGREADSPQRVLLDRTLRLPDTAKLLPAWIYTAEAALNDSGRKQQLEIQGASLFAVGLENNHLSLSAILTHLATQGITRLMVEAGSGIASAFLQEGLIDRLYWFRAPLILGEKGLSALTGAEKSLSVTERFTLEESRTFGNDTLDVFTLRAI